ncbi:MAG TPA: hypothetical protein VEA59_06070 [Patescibacteria group bacterium]|nr:hypothetical protein [Patescibacteria group bacterium]
MNKNNIVILILIGLVVAGVLLLSYVLYTWNRTNTGGSGGQVQEQFTVAETAKLSDLLTTFVSLYNTYTTGDASNVRALGDYATVSFQNIMADRADQLEDTLPQGYSLITKAVPETFQAIRVSDLKATAEISATQEEIAPDKATSLRQVKYKIFLFFTEESWKVDGIEEIQ